LAVIPDPVRCILEAERVLKPGGQMAVFDKFLGKEKRVSVLRKILNPFANMLFSDINRSFEHILKNTGLRIISDENADFKGAFRLIRLKKID
jgi:ubiquinone/menaquinone biosynthesis C-methylase UbiE